MKKKILEKFILFLATLIAKPILLAYQSTLKIKVLNSKFVRECQSRNENIIFEFWHEYMILPLLVHANRHMSVLVSQHFDGEVISRILKSFGFRTVRGSSTRGGSAAYLEMKKRMAPGRFEIGFTPDGPTGPRRNAKPGLIKLAVETGAPVIPISVASTNFKRLKSWDRLFIMLPFSKCSLIYGKPLYFSKTKDLGKVNQHLLELNEITNKLEGLAQKCLSS
ncbi:MAG: lysophospholipid acyltransferase family protein [Calditrichota bacterium]